MIEKIDIIKYADRNKNEIITVVAEKLNEVIERINKDKSMELL